MTPTIETVEALDEARARVLAQDNDAHLVWIDLSQGARDFYIARASKIRQADERAGLVTLPGVMTSTARSTIRDNGGPTALAYALAAWIDILRTNPFASAVQGEGGE